MVLMASKPLVKTFTRDKSRKISLITSCLKGYPEGLNPKSIAFKTGLNVNSVKSLLPQIPGVKRVMRGLYKVVSEGDGTPSQLELKDWNFHNLILSTSGSSRPVPVGDFRWGLVNLNFVSSVSGVTLRVATDFPLNVSSICFVAGFLSFLTGSPLSSIMVSSVEFNHDYKNLRLDGVKCISVDSLVEQFKVYQKRVGLRVEHKTKVPLSVETVVDMLRDNPNSVDLHHKLAEQRKALERLVVVTSKNSDLLFKLIDKLRGDVT